MSRFVSLMSVLLLFAVLFVGCGGELFDEKDVLSAREHLADEAKGGDLLQAMDKAGVDRVVLAGAYNITFDPKAKIAWESSKTNNELVMNALERAPGRIVSFPLIRGDEPDLMAYALSLAQKKARGFRLANGLPEQRRVPLDDARLDAFYAWCELNHLHILIDVDMDRFGDELQNLLRNYPQLTIIGGRMLGLIHDVPRLHLLMQRFNNLYLDFSFGWDAEKKAGFEHIAAQREAFDKLMEKHYGRILWGTQIILARDSGRNVDWLTQYILDNRFFLERSSVKLKLLLDGHPTLVRLDGLDLDKLKLAHLYNLNLEYLLKQEPAHLDDADLSTLLTDLPPGATMNLDGDHRLIVACVTGMKNPVEGMFSARVKNMVSGVLANWQEINGIDTPVKIVTVAPLDKWVPASMHLNSTAKIEVLPNSEAVRHRLLAEPTTLAFVPFDGLLPGMRIIPVDGESPDTPYIRDCARRGGAMIRYYFSRYPLLIPLSLTGEPKADLVFNPHELRRVVLTDHLVPAMKPSRALAEDELEPVIRAFFKATPLLQGFDLTAGVLAAPFAESCTADSRCLDVTWIDALDYAGVDLIATTPAIAAAGKDLFDRHNLAPLPPGAEAAQTYRVRNHRFTFVSFDTASENWSAKNAQAAIAERVAAGETVFVFLATPQAPSSMADTAYQLAKAKPAAVIFVGDFAPGGLELVDDVFVIYGLGSLGFGERAKQAFPVSFISRFSYYKDRLVSVELTPIRRHRSKLSMIFGNELTEVMEKFYQPPRRQ